jgi:type II secretory pathway pseudopilin PulG
MKRGMTIIELIVAITLFVTVITLVLGSFVSISRTKLLVSSMKESQNKIRLISEMITRFGKEADRAKVTEGGRVVEFYFYKKDNVSGETSEVSKKMFKLADGGESLVYYSCPSNPASPLDPVADEDCSSEELLNVTDLGYKYQIQDRSGANSYNIFSKRNTIPPTLELKLKMLNITTTNNHFDDSIELTNLIILENVK